MSDESAPSPTSSPTSATPSPTALPRLNVPSTAPETVVPPDVELGSVEAAQTSIARMKTCLAAIDEHCSNTDVSREPDFVATTKAEFDEATALSKQIAAFLEKQRTAAATASREEIRAVKLDFVEGMKQFQQTQRSYARKREALVEYELIQTADVSPDALKRAKDEEAQLVRLAEETKEVRDAFVAVGQIVGAQTPVVEAVLENVKDLKLQIGRAISEEEQAAYLRMQSVRKKCLVFWIVVLVLGAIATPIVLYCVSISKGKETTTTPIVVVPQTATSSTTTTTTPQTATSWPPPTTS
ncbi:Aste57867_14384 [Aphanomyces stellatus]|uniref:Aste57867_14384 protein n=1 Tax=Aphanomyces stellatus TaxID=120398 RepID=A0A485L2Z3_9STRA|nr:hypothetical protein As57867_014330 [Aphanomyces stellatus]VFT91207.1 Aste57867_14384 [Aphanomyces stellatus]